MRSSHDFVFLNLDYRQDPHVAISPLNIVLEGNLRALVGGRGEARVFLSTRRLGSDLTIVTTALDPMGYVLRRDDSD
jgi:hypothetical protein